MSLTNKQRAFVEAYLVKFNATRAAEAAGYSGNYGTLAATGSRLLKNDKVRKVIDNRLTEDAMLASEILHHLSVIARGPAEGQFRLKALELLGKAHKMFDKEEPEQGTDKRPFVVKVIKGIGSEDI